MVVENNNYYFKSVAENSTFCINGYIYNINDYTKTNEFSDAQQQSATPTLQTP